MRRDVVSNRHSGNFRKNLFSAGAFRYTALEGRIPVKQTIFYQIGDIDVRFSWSYHCIRMDGRPYAIYSDWPYQPEPRSVQEVDRILEEISRKREQIKRAMVVNIHGIPLQFSLRRRKRLSWKIFICGRSL